jgi:hypothetical protein
VFKAHNGDTIQITPEDWGGPRHITLTHGELLLKHDVTIESVGEIHATIDGNNSSRVFEIAPEASVEFDDLFIIHGNAKAQNPAGNASLDGDGGAILNEGSLTLDNCFVGNNGYSDSNLKNLALKAGGGMYNDHGYLLLVDCSLYHNFADVGGGIYNDRGTLTMTGSTLASNSTSSSGGAICTAFGTVEIDHSTLVANYARVGGAVASFAGSVQFNSTDVEKNTATLLGGALFNEVGSMTVNPGCTLKDNHAVKAGGGIYNEVGKLYVTSTSLIHNISDGDGGGIDSVGGSVDILDCTLAHNTADGGVGGAIYARLSKVTITDSHLYLNSAIAGGAIYNQKGELTVTDSELDSNSADFFGGGIANFEGTVQVTDSQFITNSAPVGGGIFNSLGTVMVGTTLFWQNGPDTIDGPYIDQGGNNFA